MEERTEDSWPESVMCRFFSAPTDVTEVIHMEVREENDPNSIEETVAPRCSGFYPILGYLSVCVAILQTKGLIQSSQK